MGSECQSREIRALSKQEWSGMEGGGRSTLEELAGRLQERHFLFNFVALFPSGCWLGSVNGIRRVLAASNVVKESGCL